MNTEKTQIEKMNKKLQRLGIWAIVFFVFTILWIIFAPFFLVTYSWIDFTESGQIGDTIGGIAAPTVGLLSAVLVYLSFRAQTQANNIQIKALRDEQQRIDNQSLFISFEKEFADIRENIQKLEYVRENFVSWNAARLGQPEKETITPSRAIEEHLEHIKKLEAENFFYIGRPDIFYLLTRLKNVHFRISTSTIKDKELLLENIHLFYVTFLNESVSQNVGHIKNKKYDELLAYLHEKIGGLKKENVGEVLAQPGSEDE